jgi:glycosyltransferase involved in cell wall biosynthesis
MTVAPASPTAITGDRGDRGSVRVFYTFPHRIGAGRICDTAWYQVEGAAAAGASMRLVTASVERPLPGLVEVRKTLAIGRARLPYRVVGDVRAIRLHDRLAAWLLRREAKDVDLVHAWPLGALETLKVARELGIPTVLERPNAHTRFAYEVVRDESERLGVELPPDHEHAYNEELLAIEEQEYEVADHLLCPSDFVVQTFLDQGVPGSKLVRHTYGYDETVFFAPPARAARTHGLTMLYVGVAAVRKGLHFALEAWLRSSASERGTFLVAGEMLPSYGEKLAPMLDHPSVHVLGHRTDVPELMRQSDVFVLPTIEEGFGLVCVEALASGCVPVVSDAVTDVCVHGENALVHHVGDVDRLTEHITELDRNRDLLERLRQAGLETAPNVTWAAAGRQLTGVYRQCRVRSAPVGVPH